MHQLRINISFEPKIMINSQEVCFDIARQQASSWAQKHKFFSYKNYLGSFCRNGKQFI
jgi:hypothetical protein